MRKGNSAENARRGCAECVGIVRRECTENAEWDCARFGTEIALRLLNEMRGMLVKCGRECASFVVIPATERESPSVCENASRVSRHCVGNAPNNAITFPTPSF